MSIQDEGGRWYIDALDADGGIAFASFRRVDDRDDAEFGEEHAVVMVAPHFHPSPVSHRALSLGAINRGAQSGVYIGDREVAFESLDQLVEFVRRAYVGGGANGSAPNTEMPPVPPKEPQREGPSGAERPEEGWGIYGASRAIIDWLTHETDVGHQGESQHPPYGDGFEYGGRELITRTGVSIGCSLLQRMPYRDDPTESQWRWLMTADHLQQLLGYVGVSAFGMVSSMRQKLASAGARLINDQRHWMPSTSPPSEQVEDADQLAWATYRLIIDGEVTPPFHHLDLPHHYRRRYPYEGYGGPRDVFSTLAALPIPGDVERPDGLGEDSSIADFLAHCCATSTIAENSSAGTGLLVFAAFCLVAPVPTPHFEMLGGIQPFFQVAYRDALQWLSQQFRSKLPHEMRQMVIGDR